ncbi:MAG: acetyl-CoA carboxylase biotin carboxyl carrier protein [bacterium]
MDIEYITKLIELISDSKVDEIELEEDGKKIRISKSHATPTAPQPMMYSVAPPSQNYQSPASTAQATPVAAEASTAPPSKLQEVKSPIVGTFYRAPAPDAPPFVEIGSMIAKGSPLCIVEAMKLMNEIESDVSGKIVQIMVENGDPIEYDQVLFMVEPA